jgi:hypothetical protein
VGLGATGESDTRNYYDRLSSDQKNDLGPMLDRLDEVMIRSALGDKPDDLFYEWNSLWQLTDQEKADVATKKATVYTADVNAGLIPPEVLREGRENQLIEDGTYPGLESALEEYGEQNLDEYNQAVIAQMGARAALMAPDDPNDPKGGSKKAKAAQAEFKRRRALPPPRPPAARQDDSWTDDHLVSRGRARYTPAFDETTPRSLYVRRDVLNGDEILAHFAEQGVDVSVVDPEELHVTILYSRQPVDWIKMGEAMSYGPVNYSRADEESDEEYDMCVRAGGPRVMEAYGTPPDTLVMCFASSALTWRHQDMVYRGASHDYDDYNPHLSIAPWDGTDPREIEPWTGEIELGPEIFEPTKVGGAGGAAADYDPDQLRDPGEDETEVEDYNPNQPRDKRGRWSGGGGGSGGSGASGRSSTGGTSRSKSGVKKGARAKREKLPDLSDPKRLAKYRQNTDFIRRLNQANEDRPTFESVMADLSASKVTKAQLITILKDYRFTRNYEYSARMSRERLLNALRVEFTDNKRFKNKIAASGKGSLLGLDVDDYSPDQPRVPGGQEGGGQFTTQGGTGYSRVLTKAGIYTRLFKVKRLDGGQSFNAKYKKEPINPEGNPQIVEVAQQVRGVKGKWNKNTDQAGDFAAGAGWLTLKEFPELGMFADQFWRDAAEFMTPREYKYAQSHFATRTKAFTEGFRATYSPNGRAFGLSRARTSEVFGRSTTQMRSGIDSVFAPKKPGFVAGMGERVAKFFGV